MNWQSWAYGAYRHLRNGLAAILLFQSPLSAEEVTIAALGDSLTQGYGLPADQGFVPQLETWLQDQGADVKLINAGVSGDTTAGGLSRIAWTLTPDVDALIVALGGNDILRGIDPGVSRANLDGILQIATETGLPILLIGLDAPSNYGTDYETAFEAMYPELAKKYGILHHPDFLAALTAIDDQAQVLTDYMQPDAIHPNADGISLIVQDIGPSVLKLIE